VVVAVRSPDVVECASAVDRLVERNVQNVDRVDALRIRVSNSSE
jgi:hypothetical protein